MVRDPADEWLLADAERRGFQVSDCEHDPRCKSSVAHYEREFGIMLQGGPSEARILYNEVPAGIMGQDDLSLASSRERGYTKERLDKKKRGHKPGPARVVSLPANDCD
jgi:hypothetical protein